MMSSIYYLSLLEISNLQVYHIEKIDGYFWFALTDFSSFNEVHVLDANGQEVNIFQVGINPGDLLFGKLMTNCHLYKTLCHYYYEFMPYLYLYFKLV